MTFVHASARRPRVAVGLHALTRRWGGWAALTLSVAIYAAVSVLMHQPFRAGGLRLRYFDLRIYRLGALRVIHGTPLYAHPMLEHLGFTYPPFAGVLMAPLGWLPLTFDELAVTGLNVLLLLWTLRRALLIPLGARSAGLLPRGSSRARAWSIAAALAAAVLWLEPISVTIGYGQINLLIAALVVFDLSRPDHARTKGIAIGLAAAIKLTPLLFVVYLLLSRRGRAAAAAAMAFAASVALSFTVVPRDALAFWGHPVAVTSRVGNAMDPMDQSLHGVIARLTGVAHLVGGWELVTAGIVACGLALAVRASRRGDEAAGFSLAALSALLASPISWSHHWTLAVPALVLLAGRALQHRSRALLTATGVLVIAGYAYLPEFARDNFISARGVASLLSTDPYPVLAVLVLAVCLISAIRARLRQPGGRRRPRTVLRPTFPSTVHGGHLNHGLR